MFRFYRRFRDKWSTLQYSVFVTKTQHQCNKLTSQHSYVTIQCGNSLSNEESPQHSYVTIECRNSLSNEESPRSYRQGIVTYWLRVFVNVLVFFFFKPFKITAMSYEKRQGFSTFSKAKSKFFKFCRSPKH